MAAGPARVVLYVDEATPGNQLRPNKARSYYAIYWIIAEYPDWFRSRHGGWHDLCQIKVSTVEDIPGGISAVTSKVLELFWSPDPNEFNFERLGVLLDPPAVAGPANAHAPAAAGPALGVVPAAAGPALGVAPAAAGPAMPAHLAAAGPAMPAAAAVAGPAFHLRATFGAFLLDERAEQCTAGSKGASGTKLCMSCENCVARIHPDSVAEGFVHFTSPGLAGCRLHTYESWSANLDCVHDQHGQVTQARFKEMEQALGIKYDPLSLQFSCMREVARVPETRVSDWMHTLVASGGIAQHVVNGFCLALAAGPSAFTLADLDTFAATVVLPRAQTRLQRGFFSKRVVEGAKKHIRAFASEVLSALQVLGLFTSVVLAPSGALPDNVVVVQLTCAVLDLLLRGDAACAHTERLALLM